MYRKILIAIDGTPTSSHALDQALVLARSEEAEVVLAAVVPAYGGNLRLMGDTSALADMRRPFEQALHDAEAKAKTAGVQTTTRLLDGDPVEELLSLAEVCKADLISMGKRGNYYSDLIPIGSTASKVLRLADTDVLLTPMDKELRLDRILAPIDGSPPSLRAAQRATALAARYGAALHLVTVYELPLEGFVHDPDMDRSFREKTNEFQRPLVQAAEEQGLRDIKTDIRQGTPAHKILQDIITDELPGLVVMGSSGHGRFRHLLLGSVAERILGCGAAPVLLAKPSR